MKKKKHRIIQIDGQEWIFGRDGKDCISYEYWPGTMFAAQAYKVEINFVDGIPKMSFFDWNEMVGGDWSEWTGPEDKIKEALLDDATRQIDKPRQLNLWKE